jgi:hypothetical protein
VEDITKDVLDSLGSANVTLSEHENANLLEKLQLYAMPFNAMNIQYKRDSYFRKQYGMVDGKSIFLGNRYDQRVDPVTGSMRQIIVRDTFQYVPLLKLIELLLNDQSIFKDIMQSHASRDGVMRDFCDGSLFQSIPLFVEDKNALQLCLYFDECEVVNPLGSLRGIHKIGFIYLTLRNVRPMFNSRLSNIHIVAAFNSLDRVKYGFDKILAPIVKDIKELEKGVDFRLQDGRVLHKRGTLVQVVGDNLGVNQLYGFVESFSAVHFCRLCMISKGDCNVTHRDDGLQMRNKDQYTEQLQSLLDGKRCIRDCGIKNDCLLNSLQYFHITENVTVDIMHDFLEGIIPYELKLIMSSFIYDRKYFSLEVFS